MTDLKPGGSDDREEQGSSSDPKDRSSPMDTSDNSQSPRVAHRDTPRYHPDTSHQLTQASAHALQHWVIFIFKRLIYIFVVVFFFFF